VNHEVGFRDIRTWHCATYVEMSDQATRIFAARRYALARYQTSGVCLSVCHLCPNG